MPSLLNTTRSAGSPGDTLKWSIYYEPEGQGDPNPSRIRQDLDYLAARYFNHDSYLRVNGRPVVFVWADSGDGDAMARRWHEAVSGAPYKPYIVLKVYSGYEDTRYKPDSWHQYGPAKAYSEHLPYSATVSPGFWLKGESPRLGRSVDRFSRDVERMVESGAFWHLITSWNEWGEGTAVEPAREYGNRYLAALAGSGTARPTSTPSTAAPSPEQRTTTTTRTSPKPSSGAGVRFSAAGDMGATSATSASLNLMVQRDVQFHLALGDLGYDDVGSEQEWCSYIRSKVASMPMQLLVGNHEDDDREDGHINEFARCLPDSMNSVGQYATEYYFDVGGLARIIMIGADNDVNGVKYDYERGTSHYKWLSDAIDGARSKGLPWVIVGAHKVCITAGKKPCEIGPDLVNLLIDKKVDLVVHGHEHTYQRSKQVRCIEVDRFRSDCVVDDGADDTYGKGRGLVWVVSGAFGGGGLTDINRSDPEFQYLAASMGGNSRQPGRGYLEVDLTGNELRAEFIGSTTSYRDRFVIR